MKSPRTFRTWLERHPATAWYIALVVTVELLIQLYTIVKLSAILAA